MLRAGSHFSLCFTMQIMQSVKDNRGTGPTAEHNFEKVGLKLIISERWIYFK